MKAYITHKNDRFLNLIGKWSYVQYCILYNKRRNSWPSPKRISVFPGHTVPIIIWISAFHTVPTIIWISALHTVPAIIESLHYSRTYHGWSRWNGLCLALFTYIWPKNQTSTPYLLQSWQAQYWCGNSFLFLTCFNCVRFLKRHQNLKLSINEFPTPLNHSPKKSSLE